MSANEELRALLQAERAVSPPSAAADLGWKRLGADIAANVVPLPVASGPLKVGLWLVPKWMLAGFALGLVGAGTVAPLLKPSAALGEAKHVATLHTLSPARVPAATLPATSAPELAPPDSHAATPASLSFAHLVGSPDAQPSAGATRATFDAELGLISLAKAKLDANDQVLARSLLTQHAERFPTGVFAVEREALLALIDCQRRPKNARAFQQFAAAHPSSPLLARLQRACQSAPVTALHPSAPSSTASFASLPKGSAPPGERTSEPRQGEAK
ncbi:MAG TPA: hypothetical protein VER96_26225 [Polyangiaceae bacterium]|nr:hypothetical protein [Polyangiaceae bacterium]